MKLTKSLLMLWLMLGSATVVLADIARPPATPQPNKTVLHTSLVVIPDEKAYDARLLISQDSLNELREALANPSPSASMTQRIMSSPTRTVIAGLCLFLSLSFAGVWLMRSAQPRGQKTVVALLFGVALIGAAAILAQANAGPPPSYQWRYLSQNLTANKPTYASVNIEIMPEGYGMKLIVPVKKQP
ncbi:MAG TPA: hypothetical protein VJT50_08805 [Pyrinomonadaceae bacterium]|nr:hypothetical protein [Pyrinomonadaceae bacterium]